MKRFKASGKTEEEDFYQVATSWRAQCYDSQQTWLNRTLLGLGVISIALILSLSANCYLFPLKQTVPFLYTLNETTGELTQIGAYSPDQVKGNWLMTRFLLIRYVVNRESYDADNVDRPYQITWAMSDPKIARVYYADVQSENKQSPIVMYGKNKYVTVHVLAVSRLNDDTASVRFEQTIHDRSLTTQSAIQKEAIIKWHYTLPDNSQKALDRDPLGFKVRYYQTTQVN